MTSKQATKRPRILGSQKERLVELLEDHFIRKVGRNLEVHGVEVGKEDWQSFAEVLNLLGPKKDASEWKTSFNTMKTRIRSKMLLVHASGGSPENHLANVDQKIYYMYPHHSNFVRVEDVPEVKPEEQDFVQHEASTSSDVDNMVNDSQGIVILSEPVHDSEREDLPVYEEEQQDAVVNDDQNTKLIYLLEQFVDKSAVGNSVDDSLWEVLASHLNTLGPSMDVMEWKLHVDTWKFSVRSRAHKILAEGGIPQNYLSDQELRLYKMIPFLCHKHSSSVGSNCANGGNVERLNPLEDTALQPRYVSENDDLHMLDSAENEDSMNRKTTQSIEEIDYEQRQQRKSFRPLATQPLVPADDVVDLENLDIAEDIDPVDDFVDLEILDTAEDIDPVDDFVDLENLDTAEFGCNQQQKKSYRPLVKRQQIVPTTSRGRSVSKPKRVTLNFGLATGQLASSRTETEPVATSDADNITKEFKKVNDIQRERLIQLVQNNFLKTVGRFSGANGVEIKRTLWEQFASELNKLGPPKSVKQWKDCLDYIKGNAKMKLAVNRSNNNEFGRGRKVLTRLEEKLVSVYGIETLDGEQGLGECGFNCEKTIARRTQDSHSNDFTEEQRKIPGVSGKRMINSAGEAGGKRSTTEKRPEIPGSSASKRMRKTTNSAIDHSENSENENPAPSTRNQSVQSGRGRTGRIRNRFTSYEMVERSINAQESFIEQNNKNHSESVYMFTHAVNSLTGATNTLTEVLREFLNK